MVAMTSETTSTRFFVGAVEGSGEVNKILEKDATVRHAPASLAKMMTALLFSEWLARASHPDSEITILAKDRRRGSGNNMAAGEAISGKDLLANLMLASSDTAAQTIARIVGGALGGDERRFVEEMNSRAARLGMNHTFFCNAHGLHHASMLSTASDLARLAGAACRNPMIALIWRKPRCWVKLQGTEARSLRVLSTVKMGRRADLMGGKTGTSRAAGFNVAAVAGTDDEIRVAVVLGARSNRERFRLANELLD